MTDMNDGDKQARALLYYAIKERWSHEKRGRNVVYRVRFEVLEEGHIRKVLGRNRKIYIRRYRLVA